jgi:protein SCO1/2
MLRRAVPAVIALVACGAALAGCGTSSAGERYAGQTLSPALPAPDFTARGLSGRPVRLSQFRGRAVLLTFLYTRCPDVCPLTVAGLRAALDRLGDDAGRAAVIAVSVDPAGDTPARVRRFIEAHGMTGRMEYLTGSRAELEPIWRRYHIAVGEAAGDEVAHSGEVRGITAGGRQKTVYPHNLSSWTVAHDVAALAED